MAHNFALRHGWNEADFLFHAIAGAGLRLEIDLADIFADDGNREGLVEAMRRKSNMTEVQPRPSDPKARCRRPSYENAAADCENRHNASNGGQFAHDPVEAGLALESDAGAVRE